MEGIVKWYNRKKGYGFLIGQDSKEYFVHYTAIAKGKFLRDNDKVAFEFTDGDKGPMAKNVLLLQKASELEDKGEIKTEVEDIKEVIVKDINIEETIDIETSDK